MLFYARVAELVDALASGASGHLLVEVQVLSRAPNMASLAQLVRASGCGSEGRGFEPHSSPQKDSENIEMTSIYAEVIFYCCN